MARNTDFIGFTFNGRHSSEFNIYSVSDGSRYQENLVPDPNDYTEQVPGSAGEYYFGSDLNPKEFPLSIAYDKLDEVKIRELRNWLSPDTVGELIFDERPYKSYTAKISSSPSLEFICFNEYDKETGKTKRVYKGEGSIDFICYYSLGATSGEKKELKWYREQVNYNNYSIIKGDSCLTRYELEEGTNVGIGSIEGQTIESGSGEKSPANPYTLIRSEPSKITVCGKNLMPTRGNGTSSGISCTVNEDGSLRISGTSSSSTSDSYFNFPRFYIEKGFYCFSSGVSLPTGMRFVLREWESSNNEIAVIEAGQSQVIKEINFTGEVMPYIVVKLGTTVDITIYPQLEKGNFYSGYEPYHGESFDLPNISTMYSLPDSTIDTYDATNGIKIQRIKYVEFDGTENWRETETKVEGKSRFALTLSDIKLYPSVHEAAPIICSHYPAVPLGDSGTWGGYQGISVTNSTYAIAICDDTVDSGLSAWKAFLSAQYQNGTPVTVVYALGEPVETQLETFPSIINTDSESYYYFTDSTAKLILKIYEAKYPNIDEWAISSGLKEDLEKDNPDGGYDHYIKLPSGNGMGFQLFNPGDLETDFTFTFDKPNSEMKEITFSLSGVDTFVLSLRSDDTQVDEYGAVSEQEKQIASMEGGTITIDTKKNRIMYKNNFGNGVVYETPIYFALKKGRFFKIPKNRDTNGGYDLIISTSQGDSIDFNKAEINYDYLYY